MKKPRPLAVNITITLAVGLSAVMLLLALYMHRALHREVYELVARKDAAVLELQANNAALPLWNFDLRQLQAIVDNIAKGEGIQSARIISSENGIDVIARNPVTLDEFYEAPPLERDIVYSDGGKVLHLGTLTVVPNYAQIALSIQEMTLRILVGIGILLVFLVIIIYLIAHRAIAPVTRLSSFMATSISKAPPIETADSAVIEVQQLYSALHLMQDNYLAYQQELMAEKENAERANRVKSDFLTTMSHELRTPLNSILGLSNMFIQDTSMAPEHHEMAVVIRKASTVLLNIINDILDLSKIESENLKLEEIPFNLRDTISNILQTLLPMASSKGLSLNSRYNQPDFQALVLGDPLRVGRIITNLVGNAIKYTEAGSVHVIFDFKHMGDDRKKIQFCCQVTDTGIGIAENKLPLIFEKFTQADETITRKYGGTGLGLAISKELVTLMGGEISVESELGKGSTFSFCIPFTVAEALPPEKPKTKSDNKSLAVSGERKSISSAKILLAEDHLLNQLFMKKLLTRLNIGEFVIKETGKLAYEAFLQGGYDMVLMDCHMPEMNGYDATRAIRDHEKIHGGHIPIIAMTADAMVGTREKCLEAGMDYYLSKPVDIDDFRGLLEQLFIFPDSKATESGNHAPAPATGTADPCVDISALRNYADTQHEIRTFINIFVRQTTIDLELLRGQCTDGENITWKEIAHRMKGASGTAGAVEMQKLCMEAQEMAIASKEAREHKYHEIADAFEKAKAFFTSIHPDGTL